MADVLETHGAASEPPADLRYAQVVDEAQHVILAVAQYFQQQPGLVLAGAGGVGQHDCSAVSQPAQQHVTLLGGDREQGRALIAAADRDSGRARLRSAAAIRLLLHNALRVDEVFGADIADLGSDSRAPGPHRAREGQPAG